MTLEEVEREYQEHTNPKYGNISCLDAELSPYRENLHYNQQQLKRGQPKRDQFGREIKPEWHILRCAHNKFHLSNTDVVESSLGVTAKSMARDEQNKIDDLIVDYYDNADQVRYRHPPLVACQVTARKSPGET